MSRRWWLTIVLTAAMAAIAGAQDGRTEFDVVSIRPATQGGRGSASTASLRFRPGGVRAPAITAERLIALAYPIAGVPRLPAWIVGGPDWMASARFEFIATIPAATPEADLDARLAEMLRGVLADRFRLRGRLELRPVPIYALTTRRSGVLGPLLRRTDPRSEPWSGSGPEYISAINTTMDALASRLTALNAAGRVVVNRTGLTGAFDLDLFWSPARTAVTGAAPPEVDGPSLFTAVQEQLGLRLEPRTEPQEVFVVDSIERPTPN